MRFVLICYKPSSEDHCRGCYMRSYKSDCLSFSFDSEEDIKSTIKQFAAAELKAHEEAYQFCVIKDGEIISDFGDLTSLSCFDW